ncbi:MAG: class I SAM-dependent methyltransferase [Granulosicoccaceae bacterium]
MALPAELAHLRKPLTVEEELCGHRMKFETTWGLFSPKAIDDGTQLLLKHMRVEPTDKCLDLGCGYGPMGLWMAKQAHQGHSTLIDKDFVAVDFSQRNAELNRLNNVDVFLSNGFSHIPADSRFDVIASNLPAKAGNELFYLYFYDALARMEPGGRFYVVVINGLRKYVARAFGEVFGNHKKLKQGANYTVAMAEKQS